MWQYVRLTGAKTAAEEPIAKPAVAEAETPSEESSSQNSCYDPLNQTTTLTGTVG
jgi:hypothetical protein